MAEGGWAVTVKTQTLRDIRALLESVGHKPRRKLGQNFLIDGNLLRRLVEAAEIRPNETVIEVGGGTGALTDLLADRAGRVLVIELDPRLHGVLAERFRDHPRVVIHQGDALAGKHRLCDFILQALEQADRDRTPISLVSNLPYGIATPLLIDLLLVSPRMGKFCFTVQKEVADRFRAAPRTKDYGLVSILLQATCRVQSIARVPATAFWPRPQVESHMLRLDRIVPPLLSFNELTLFADLVRTAFRHRRKTLNHNLAMLSSDRDFQVSAPPWPPNTRAEELTVIQWLELHQRLSPAS